MMDINLKSKVSKKMDRTYKDMYQEKVKEYNILREPLEEIESEIAKRIAQKSMLISFGEGESDIKQLETEVVELSERYTMVEKKIYEASLNLMSQIAWLQEKIG